MGAFVEQAKARLHRVVFVTSRASTMDNHDIESDAKALGIEIVYQFSSRTLGTLVPR